MKPRTAKSMELYDVMLKRGYPKEFCEQITLNLNTDWTATRMLGDELPMALECKVKSFEDGILEYWVSGTNSFS